MASNTIFQQMGLTASIYDAPWNGGAFVKSFTDDVKTYGHEIAASGGFLSADLEIGNQPFTDLEEWVEMGLGRELKVKTGDGGTIFEGVINRIEFTVEGFHVTIGPLMDVSNRIALMYSILDVTTGQPIQGFQGTSGYLDDVESQRKYGIHVRVFSGGTIQPELVNELAQLVLKRSSVPAKSEDMSFGQSSQAFTIRVSVLGWYAFLDKFTYGNTTDTTMVDLTAKIRAILAQEPNGLFPRALLETNTLQVSLWENSNTTSWGQLKALVAFGDASFNRYTLGVYENRNVVYQRVDEIITYYRPLRETISTVLDTQGNLIDPWLVRPGVWVNVQDLAPTHRPTDQFQAIDTMFIESVSFKAPDSLSLNGSNIFKLDQRLAQLGISGIG